MMLEQKNSDGNSPNFSQVSPEQQHQLQQKKKSQPRRTRGQRARRNQ